MIHHVGILSLNLCKFKRNVISVAAKDVGKSVSLCTTVGNMENLTFFGIQERNWKYLLKYVVRFGKYNKPIINIEDFVKDEHKYNK